MTAGTADAAERAGRGPLLLGVRHHGPGSARAVRAALAAHEPKVLLIEGPPEADAVVELAADEGMVPPVALLAHAVNEPGKAAFWPLAEFSPEWVAIRWALERGVPVRFMDLPAAHALALTDADLEPEADTGVDGEPGEGAEPDGSADAERDQTDRGAEDDVRIDPIAVLAETAGYDDPERWWEDVVEHRGTGRADPLAPFAALGEAMGALREAHGDGGHRRDLIREAHMRLRLREARKEFGDPAPAVVCGAWHVPALSARTTATADRQLLKGLPKVKAEITWVPWTHRRLARRSGYGAGIVSPGWYSHLFSAPDRPVERWMTKVAGLLREQDRSVSSAHVIEAVRLADTLAAMRGRPLAGLTETTDAIRAVMCEGSDVPLGLIQDRLIVGDVLGEVPDDAPAVPLQRDLARQQRSVRLKPEAAERELDLDLRKDTDAARSRLLHRLRLLGVDWGEPSRSRTESTGTFRESWRLRWEPELSVRVAEAGVWGTTVHEAAVAKARSEVLESDPPLAEVTSLAERCLLADLPEALPDVMRVLADRAALESDVGRLAQALPALVRTVRYGDVRGTDARALGKVAEGLAERVCVGLPPACAGLDDEGARDMRGHLDAAHQAVGLLARDRAGGSAGQSAGDGAAEAGADTGTDPATATGTDASTGTDAATGTGADADTVTSPGPGTSPDTVTSPGPGTSPATAASADSAAGGLMERWRAMLRGLARRDLMPGLLRGRCARLLLDDGELSDDEAARLMGLVLSPGTPPADAAAWIEGFLAGGGMLLVHDERLLALVDGWLSGVPGDAFTDVLPLLRRTFAEFEPGVRRSLGEQVRRPSAARAVPGEGPAGFGPGLDEERADVVLETVRLLLGEGAGV
ncbi:hypothetical protein GCM10009801_29650 [Streptomyces albiaxialis]|uniref:Uncharacterized protein n=1 Tax=Streptomyces albiaxialis TaxID=329523 RepID=A0ABN2VW76_9ACTN